ncbi:glucoamylase family protein [Capnocytophaga cynodegmi]|uniref:glucoamylase family protein n=1 Tax=Capnocytophaga cynodegmi TaxID=28189 RepID=UPI0038594FC7
MNFKKYMLIGGCFLLGIVGCNDKKNNPSNTINSSQSEKNRPMEFASDEAFLDFIQKAHFNYMWEGAEENSGLACERIHIDGNYPMSDQHIITTGGSGFGIAGLVVGMERGFITREDGLKRLTKIVSFLEKADRFHGIWSHWIDGRTGKTKPFGTKDNGGDLVESAFLIQGLLCVRQYFKDGNEPEKQLAHRIDKLWREMNWTWYLNGKDVLYWHWSPQYEWQMNFPLEGYNECLITYILAASSPTHSIPASAYHNGWARGGSIKTDKTAYNLSLILKHNGSENYGGPLFWAHYSYIGLNPKGLTDDYANYWELNKNHSLINYNYCVENPKGYKGYGKNCWGLTASYSVDGYAGHTPMTNDKAVITPTAALSSFPYTPNESMSALKHFYFGLGDKIWGKYGFYDAFSEQHNWYPQRYLAIDQLTIAPMIENYRTGLLWKLFMSCPEVQEGLKKLGFKVSSI